MLLNRPGMRSDGTEVPAKTAAPTPEPRFSDLADVVRHAQKTSARAFPKQVINDDDGTGTTGTVLNREVLVGEDQHYDMSGRSVRTQHIRRINYSDVIQAPNGHYVEVRMAPCSSSADWEGLHSPRPAFDRRSASSSS